MANGRARPGEGRVEGEASLGELFRQLAQDGGALVRQEIELAKGELGESVRRTATGAGWIVAGAVVALLGLLVLIAALVVGLGDALDNYWLAALLVGGGFVVIGAILALLAAKRLKRVSFRPNATIETLQDDKRWARAEIQQVKRELTRATD
jgi:hypothetical protein